MDLRREDGADITGVYYRVVYMGVMIQVMMQERAGGGQEVRVRVCRPGPGLIVVVLQPLRGTPSSTRRRRRCLSALPGQSFCGSSDFCTSMDAGDSARTG